MDRVRDRVDEPLVGVGREVDVLARLGRDRPGHLNVEFNLAVGRLAGGVGAAVDAHGGHRRRRKPESAEVGGQVGRRVAAAELDDRDRLPGPVGAGRGLVEAGHLQRRQRLRGAGSGGMRRRCPFRRGRQPAKVGPRLRAVVQAEDGGDDPRQLGRHRQGTGPVPVGHRPAAVRLRRGDRLQRGTERGRQVRYGPAHLQAAGRELNLGHGQPVPAEHVGDETGVRGIGAVALPEFLRRDRFRTGDQLLGDLGDPAQQHRDRDDLMLVKWRRGRLGSRQPRALTTR